MHDLPPDLRNRLRQYARDWRLGIEESFETESSVISFVRRDGQSLVLKLIKQAGDEWHAGEVLNAFDGKGVVRVYEHVGGAMLLERLRPGRSLSQNRNDDEATDILADVIKKFSPRETRNNCPSVEDLAKGFDRYLANNNRQIRQPLVESAQRVFADLCASQGQKRLLHGDLHHYNVLLDSDRGWLAIDPKGVIGELEFEIGAVLRNPFEQPELFLSRSVIESRLKKFASQLTLDYGRMLAWGFAQAVLSAIWLVEDGHTVNPTIPTLRLAEVIYPMLAPQCI
jgi:streptomycin 6-kinase